MQATIISIGDEILIGQTVDTNSNWLAARLGEIGINIRTILAIHDSPDEIKSTLNYAFNQTDLVIMTGGLGPTKDDKTKEVLCQYFNTKLILDKKSLSLIESFLKKRNAKINKNNYDQALVPEIAKVMHNHRGTAPGLILEENNKILVAMPGVPLEMMHLTENYLLDFLRTKYPQNQAYHKYVLVAGIPEAVLAEKLADWEDAFPDYLKLAYLPGLGTISLRFSIYESVSNSDNLVKQKIEELKEIIPDNIIAETDKKIVELLAETLKKHSVTVSTAESCTGGGIASELTSIPGSSEYFIGSIIAYSNKVKEDFLNVNSATIIKHGAVSKEVVEQMATSARKYFNTDFAVSTSGIAGPDGGTEDKPVGTVWVAVAGEKGVISKKFIFSRDRKMNTKFFTNMALVQLYKFVAITL